MFSEMCLLFVMEMFCYWLAELSFTADQINDISNWFHGRQLSWQISLHISWQKTLKIKTFCQTEQWNVANDPLLVKVMNFTDDWYTIVGMGDSAIPSIRDRPTDNEKWPPHYIFVTSMGKKAIWKNKKSIFFP